MASRKIEIFSAGCSVCNEVVAMVKRIRCPSCDVTVVNMSDPQIAQRARSLGIHSVPAVAIDGKIASCCASRGPTEAELRAAGIGQQL